jgi:signal transduction histidine kinase
VTIAGTGLGLFLCKEITTRHRGDITVRSEPGRGSEFTLVLPAA